MITQEMVLIEAECGKHSEMCCGSDPNNLLFAALLMTMWDAEMSPDEVMQGLRPACCAVKNPATGATPGGQTAPPGSVPGGWLPAGTTPGGWVPGSTAGGGAPGATAPFRRAAPPPPARALARAADGSQRAGAPTQPRPCPCRNR